MAKPILFYGSVIHCLSPTELEVLESALLVVDRNGRIIAFNKDISHIPQELDLPDHPEIRIGDCHVIELERGTFLIPGFVDTHNHAPQWAQRGLGQGMHILDWLDSVTFPNEARFEDPEYAHRVYAQYIDGSLKQGITTASYYGSARSGI